MFMLGQPHQLINFQTAEAHRQPLFPLFYGKDLRSDHKAFYTSLDIYSDPTHSDLFTGTITRVLWPKCMLSRHLGAVLAIFGRTTSPCTAFPITSSDSLLIICSYDMFPTISDHYTLSFIVSFVPDLLALFIFAPFSSDCAFVWNDPY
jgi:hypothetical protein